MKNGRKRKMTMIGACLPGLLMVNSARAATVFCSAHAPLGQYVAYLYRTGDAAPTAISPQTTIDGGKVMSFSGVSQGRWFIRVRQIGGNPNLNGQTNDGWLNSYFSTPLNLGDCRVNP